MLRCVRQLQQVISILFPIAELFKCVLRDGRLVSELWLAILVPTINFLCLVLCAPLVLRDLIMIIGGKLACNAQPVNTCILAIPIATVVPPTLLLRLLDLPHVLHVLLGLSHMAMAILLVTVATTTTIPSEIRLDVRIVPQPTVMELATV